MNWGEIDTSWPTVLLLGDRPVREDLEVALKREPVHLTVASPPESPIGARQYIGLDGSHRLPDAIVTTLAAPRCPDIATIDDDTFDGFVDSCLRVPLRIAADGMPWMKRRGSGAFIWVLLREVESAASMPLVRSAEKAVAALSRGVAHELSAGCSSNCVLVGPSVSNSVSIVGALRWLVSSGGDVNGRVIELGSGVDVGGHGFPLESSNERTTR